MNHLIPINELKEIEAALNQEQRKFLERRISNNVYDKMINRLIDKGSIQYIEDPDYDDLYQLADEYMFVQRILADEVEEDLHCDECERKLKYQYVVRNVIDGSITKLGSTCLNKLTGMDHTVINALVKSFDNIDLLYEEILMSYKAGVIDEQRFMIKVPGMPPTKIQQLELGLPLAPTQVKDISSILDSYWKKVKEEEEERRIEKEREAEKEKIIQSFTPEQLAYYNIQTNDQKNYIINNYGRYTFNKKHFLVPLDSLEEDQRIRIQLGMPLLMTQHAMLSRKQSKAFNAARAEKEKKKREAAMVLMKEKGEAEEKDGYATYNELIDLFAGRLMIIKVDREAAMDKCSRTYMNLINEMKRARAGERVLLRNVRLDIETIEHALGLNK